MKRITNWNYLKALIGIAQVKRTPYSDKEVKDIFSKLDDCRCDKNAKLIDQQTEAIARLLEMVRRDCNYCKWPKRETNGALTCDKNCSVRNPIHSLTYWQLQEKP